VANSGPFPHAAPASGRVLPENRRRGMVSQLIDERHPVDRKLFTANR